MKKVVTTIFVSLKKAFARLENFLQVMQLYGAVRDRKLIPVAATYHFLSSGSYFVPGEICLHMVFPCYLLNVLNLLVFNVQA